MGKKVEKEGESRGWGRESARHILSPGLFRFRAHSLVCVPSGKAAFAAPSSACLFLAPPPPFPMPFRRPSPLLLLLLLLSLAPFPGGVRAGEVELSLWGKECVPSGDVETRAFYHPRGGLLELSTRFRPEGSKRACWDFPLSVDLSRCAGVRLRFRAIHGDLASQINLHLRLGGTWYQATLTPRTYGLWEEQVISKASFLPEGKGTASWRNCDMLRIAAWRGSPGAFSLQVAAWEFLDPNIPVALVRGGLSRGPLPEEKRREALRHGQHLGESLARGGLFPAVVDEPDLTLSALRQIQCALLPSGEGLGENGVDTLCAFLRQGGRLGAFYALPPRLANVMQLPAGKFRKGGSLGRAITGLATNGGASFRQGCPAILAVDAPASEHLKPRAWWVDATGQKTPFPAILQCPSGFWMTYVYLRQDEPHAIPVLAAFLEDHAPGIRKTAGEWLLRQGRFALANAGPGPHERGRKCLERAEKAQRSGDYPGVLAALLALEDALASEAMPASAPESADAGEMRGVWMRSPTGFPRQGWASPLRLLKLARFNAVFPHFLSPHATAWPSSLATGRLDGAGEGAVGQCLAQAEPLNVQVHAWCQILNASDAPQEFRTRMEREGRFQRKATGETVPWLCPTQRENRMLMASLVGELARKYPLQGIHLDMVRYEGSQACVCPRCHAVFRQFLGQEPGPWPECVQLPGKTREAWERFRVRQISQLVRELAAAARRSRPRIQVSAAVYPDRENARRNVGQDWAAWLKEGMVDFLCPMDYRSSSALLQGDLARQREAAGTQAAKIRPGLGVTPNQLSRQETLRQIQAVRAAGMGGFLLFEWTPQVAEQWR